MTPQAIPIAGEDHLAEMLGLVSPTKEELERAPKLTLVPVKEGKPLRGVVLKFLVYCPRHDRLKYLDVCGHCDHLVKMNKLKLQLVCDYPLT